MNLEFLRRLGGNMQKDTKLLTLSTSVRWSGWGIVEPLMTIFIYSFTRTYGQSALIKSAYDVFFLIALIPIGIMADKVSAKKLFLIGAFIYPLVGFSYFIAGIGKFVLILIVARALNGIAYSFDSVGRDTYFRRVAFKNSLAATLGFFDTASSVFWMVGLGLCIVFSKLFQMNDLFLAVVMSSLLSLPIAFLAKRDSVPIPPTAKTDNRYSDIFGIGFSEIKIVLREHWHLLFLTFFAGITGTVGSFIIPISEYNGGGGLTGIIILSVALGAPSFLSYALGKMADRFGPKALVAAMLIQTALLMFVGRTGNYAAVFALTFSLSFMDNLIYFSIAEMSANTTRQVNYGKLSALLIAAGSVGGMVGPLLLGTLIDGEGILLAMAVLAGTSLLVLLILFFDLLGNRSKKLA